MPDPLTTLPTWAWIAIGGVAAGCVLSILNVLSSAARNEIQIHTLRVETAALRRAYYARLRERSGVPEDSDDIIDVSPVDEQPGAVGVEQAPEPELAQAA